MDEVDAEEREVTCSVLDPLRTRKRGGGRIKRARPPSSSPPRAGGGMETQADAGSSQAPAQAAGATGGETLEWRQFSVCGSRFNLPSYYNVIRPIGQGAYGIVCSATDRRTQRHVAVSDAVRTSHAVRVCSQRGSRADAIG